MNCFDADEEDEGPVVGKVGAWPKLVELVREGSEEVMLLWGLQQPTLSRLNRFARQEEIELNVDACGHQLSIFQTPSSMNQPGNTGAVMWDSGIVLAKFLEHAVDSKLLQLQKKRVVELGSGCGLTGCVAALLGADVILTDLPDRLKLLQKNITENALKLTHKGSARVVELTWGEEVDIELLQPEKPDFVIASDVVYNENVVPDLVDTLRTLCGSHTTVFLSGELRNETVLEAFYDAAVVDFVVGRVPQTDWHPEFRSPRVAIYSYVNSDERKSVRMGGGGSNSQALRLGLWVRYWLGQRLAPYHGTPPHVARRMLQLARVSANDRVVDLGCGDARLLIAAAKHHGAHGYGVELDSELFTAGKRAVEEEGLAHMITIEQKDACTVDLSTATVVALYLTVKGNMKLYPKLVQQLPSGARVVSFCWPFENLEPSGTARVDGIDLFLYEFNNRS
ncbi:hypothetical protein R1sor_015461 [Riccia sorocarpa]|uniref:Methyltransferase domain-containing protein n=1 Tax=Riccia sorocarpa TaxID=122646 RepID=A0ABD3HF07_9MARC